MEKETKNFRTLDRYVRLCEGKTVNKAEEARRFNVDECSKSATTIFKWWLWKLIFIVSSNVLVSSSLVSNKLS